MPTIEINGVTYALPEHDGVAQKVPSYNDALQALADAHSTGVAWSSWTPTWTNLTIGAVPNNATVVAKYARVGKLIVARLNIIFGSATSVSGSIIFSLPVNRAAFAGTSGLTPIGHCRLFDTSAPATLEGVIISTAVGTALVGAHDSSGAYLVGIGTGTTVPFTWAVGDEISLQIVYEGA